MKKILKKLLVSLLAVSVIVSSSAFVFADETADTEQIQLFSEGTNVVKAYDGSETINLANYPKFGLIFETNSTDVPFKGESDVSFKYSGVAESTGWNLKNENHGQNGFTLDSNAIKSINTNKMIFEMDILPMNDNNGISLRFIPNGSSSSYTAGGMFMSGKALVTGEWNKIVYVIGNKETDKTYEIYINGALVSSGTSAGYGSTGSNHKIYPHAADNAEIEMYVDNIKIIAADSYEGSASSTIASLDENITVEGNKISGIPYGTTAEELKNTLVPEDGTDIFVGNEKYRNAASDAVIENGYKIASVSADGMYTYYTAEVEYIPGDIYQKIIVKKNSLTDVSVSNISEIADSALLIYTLKDNAVNGKIYTYYLNNRENDIVCSFEEPAESMNDIKVILINNVSGLASLIPADNTVKIELAVESGVTVSGTAVADTPVSLIILSPDADLKASEFLTDTAVEDVYYAAGTNSGDDSAFTFDTVGFRSSGIYTYLIYKDGRFYTQEMFAPGTQAVINFKTGLETLATPQDLKALLDADSVTGDTGLVYDYYNELSTSEQLTLCEEIIKSMNLYEVADVNLDEFADELKYRSMIPAMVKESDANVPADRVFELLDVDNPVFNLSGSAVEAYKEMSETEQRAVCEYVCKNPDLVTNPETLQAILNVSVINTKLDNVITHSNVYDILKAYSDALDGLDFTTYSKLTTEQQTVNMGIIGKKPFETPESLINAANDLIEDAEETEEDNEDDGKKSSSGGSSKRGGGTVKATEPIQIPSETVNEENVFSDLDYVEWAQEAINILSKRGIVSGKGNKIFDPNGNVTREEFVKMIVETAGIETYTTPNSFKDVNSTDWFSKYISIAAENGITSGIGNGRFGVGENITRQDMMVMCMYLIPESAKAGSIDNYADASEVADYAKDAVATLVSLGIVNGDGGRLMPTANCTRAQAAKVIYMILKYNNQN